MSATARLETGNYRKDVNEPKFKLAEEKVIQFFMDEAKDPWTVVDLRDQRVHGDFMLLNQKDGGRIVLDIKMDQLYPTTRRFAWEKTIEHKDGTEEPGWGTSGHIDFVVYVVDTPRWQAWMINAHTLQRFMNDLFAENILWTIIGMGYRPFEKKNDDGRRAVGTAIPIRVLEQEGLIHRTVKL
jgi:hypothetical protein